MKTVVKVILFNTDGYSENESVHKEYSKKVGSYIERLSHLIEKSDLKFGHGVNENPKYFFNKLKNAYRKEEKIKIINRIEKLIVDSFEKQGKEKFVEFVDDNMWI